MALRKRSKQMTKKRPTGMASRVTKTANNKATMSRKWLVAGSAALLSSVMAIAGYWYWQDKPIEQESNEQLMPIRLVEIQGDLTQVTKEDVLTVLRAQSRNDSDDEESINFLTTDLSGLEQSLEQVPWILKAQVRRVWPDKLVIDVTEQQAVAFWNRTQLVNQYGETFTPETMPEMALPILTGPEAELSTMLERFAELQQKFEAAGHQLHELHLTQRRSWQMKLTTGIELKLGRKDLLSRVSRFIELYPLLESESDAPIERVDLRYDTGMAVLRQQRHASLK